MKRTATAVLAAGLIALAGCHGEDSADVGTPPKIKAIMIEVNQGLVTSGMSAEDIDGDIKDLWITDSQGGVWFTQVTDEHKTSHPYYVIYPSEIVLPASSDTTLCFLLVDSVGNESREWCYSVVGGEM